MPYSLKRDKAKNRFAFQKQTEKNFIGANLEMTHFAFLTYLSYTVLVRAMVYKDYVMFVNKEPRIAGTVFFCFAESCLVVRPFVWGNN
jgi:hypothetical protein